jgi:hypothetical protein
MKVSSLSTLAALTVTGSGAVIDSALTADSIHTRALVVSGTANIQTPFTLGGVSVLPTGTELNFVDGVTSAIQTQINAKQATVSVSDPITLTGASIGMVNQGTTTTVLHGNASGNPTFGAIVNTDITNSTIDLVAKVTGLLPLANGGTNANLTASNGGIFYSTASAGAILAGTATARQMLQSAASTTPAWSTTTWPATTTVNRLLWSSSANVIADLATANSGILVTSGAGVPSIATDIPTAVTIGAAYIYRVGGTDVSLADGGTNASLTASNGGIFYSTGTAGAILAGTATAQKILMSQASTAPVWSTPTFPNSAGTVDNVLQSDGTNFISAALTDTIEKAFLYDQVAAQDSDYFYEVRQSGLTLREIRVMRTGGTSSSVNAKRNRSGAIVDLLAANYSTTTSMADAGTEQNTSLSVGDLIAVSIRALSGTQDILIQFTFDKKQL